MQIIKYPLVGLCRKISPVIDMAKEIHDVNPIQQQPELLRCVVCSDILYHSIYSGRFGSGYTLEVVLFWSYSRT